MRIVLAASLMLVSGCAYPVSTTEQGLAQGELYFPGAPTGAAVVIDGKPAGLASSYDGRFTLSVSPGSHRVVVTTGGASVLDKIYVVGAGTKVAVRNE